MIGHVLGNSECSGKYWSQLGKYDTYWLTKYFSPWFTTFFDTISEEIKTGRVSMLKCCKIFCQIVCLFFFYFKGFKEVNT